eukprot:331672-Amphidinium_carterae.1
MSLWFQPAKSAFISSKVLLATAFEERACAARARKSFVNSHHANPPPCSATHPVPTLCNESPRSLCLSEQQRHCAPPNDCYGAGNASKLG